MAERKRPSAEVVLEAIQDLHAQEQIVTRETLLSVTGLPLTVIDDRLARLVDDGRIHRVQRGVFVPAAQHPPARLMAKIVLPDGTVKIELGDDHVLTLTPREARMLGNLMMAEAVQFAGVEQGQYAASVTADMMRCMRELGRKVEGMVQQSVPPADCPGAQ